MEHFPMSSGQEVFLPHFRSRNNPTRISCVQPENENQVQSENEKQGNVISQQPKLLPQRSYHGKQSQPTIWATQFVYK